MFVTTLLVAGSVRQIEVLSKEVSQRQSAERELVASEMRYRSIVEDQTEMIVRIEKDGTLRFANGAYCRWHNLNPDDLTAKNSFSFIHPDDQARVQEKIAALSRESDSGMDLMRTPRPDGSIAWESWTGRALFDQNGRHLGYQAVGRVVTDLVEARQQLRESELRYRSVVEDQREMVLRFNNAGRITFANKAYCKANGRPLEELIGTPYTNRIHIEDRHRVIEAVAASSANDPEHASESRAYAPDGSVVWESWTGRALFDDDGCPAGFQAVGRDITELHRAKQRLQESELQYRSVVEDQREMLIRVDMAGKLTFCNGEYARANNSTPEELIGESYMKYIHPEDQELAARRIGELTPESPDSVTQVRVVRPNGELRWCEWNGRILCNDNGAPIGYQAVGRDITELRKATDKLKEKENQLTHLARVSALGEMVAGISHEIKQPLATIANFSSAARMMLEELVIPDDDRKDLKSWIERISQQTHRIDAITQRLRRFSRPHSERSEVSIRTIIDEALSVLESRTRQVLTSINIDCPDDLPTIFVDQIQIEQVLVNLIRNACDAVQDRDKPREVKIQVKRTDAELRVTVDDSGPGIPLGMAKQIFNSFVTSKSSGLGIGLAISRSIIETHGGTISADPTHSGGRIVFTLPVESGAVDE